MGVYGVFAVQYSFGFFFLNNFSRVINLLLTKLARDRPGRILGAIAEYPAQLVVLDSSATVVPQWNGSLMKRKINCCYRGPQSRSGGHRYYIGIIKYCYRGPQSRSGLLLEFFT